MLKSSGSKSIIVSAYTGNPFITLLTTETSVADLVYCNAKIIVKLTAKGFVFPTRSPWVLDANERVATQKHPNRKDADGPNIYGVIKVGHFSFRGQPSQRAAPPWLYWRKAIWRGNGIVQIEEYYRRSSISPVFPILWPVLNPNISGFDVTVYPVM